MYSAEKFDVSTLNWVKGEIDETLKQARLALEAFVENSDDLTQLQTCVSYLHQVAGTLQMVELQGSARFASEMELVAITLEQGKVSGREHGFEVLMRAILQLPDYLESLLDGGSDNPIVLLPLMNELRQSRDEKPLSEAIFFNPDLSVMPKAAQPSVRVDTRVAGHKLRPHYQAALLKLLRGVDEPGQLKLLAAVLEKLFSVVESPQTRQWLWVACGFSEGVRDGGIELTNVQKQLFGKIDQLLKLIVEKGESGVNPDHTAPLIRTMLYQIANASSSGALIRELREAFRLAELLPASAQGGQPLLGGFNAELKRTVSADILEELARVKETFDIFVRSDHHDLASLTGVADSLGTMAETLVLLHHDTLSEELREQSSVLHKIVRGDLTPADTTLMGVASTILSVESTLSDWGNAAPVEQADDLAGQVSGEEVGQLGEAEHTRVVRQVMKEARDGVIRVREAISQYLEHPEDKSVLAHVPAQLHEVIGGLTMLSYRRVAQVLRACGLFIGQELVNSHALPKAEKLDALADAIMSIEYYLEAFIQSRVHPASVLDVAERGVAALGFAVDNLPEGELLEYRVAASDETASIKVAEQAPPAPAGDVVTISQPQGLFAAVNPEVDDEILEIFIEESHEELAKISALLQKWSNNPDDDEALRDLRRCFHTLKGSGRLVGAALLGEFAWAFENMLNRVIDGTIRPGPAMFDMLDQSREALTQLIANFQRGSALGDDIELLRQSAHEISEPGGMQLKQPPAAAHQPAAASAPAAAPAAVERIELEPVLLEIYEKETEGHLEQVQDFLESYENGSHRVNEPLIRALHTLTGSSRMAGVMPISEVSSLLEKYTKTIQIERIPISEEGVALLADCLDYTRKVLAHLQNGELNPLPDNTELVARATALYETVMHAEESVAARPEAGLAALPEEISETRQVAQAETVAPEVEIVARAAESSSDTAAPLSAAVEIPGLQDLEKAFEILDAQVPATAEEPIELLEVSEPVLVSSEPAAAAVEEYDQELMDIFLEEGSDILNASEETLQAWVKNPDDRSLVEMLQRQLHTLKGGARMAGITAVGDLSHSLETTFEAVVEGRLSRTKRMTDLLQLAHDRLVMMLEQVRNHQPLSGGDDLINEIYQLGSEKATVDAVVSEPLPNAEAANAPEASETEVTSSAIDPLEHLLQTGKERIDRISGNIAVWGRSPEEVGLLHAIKSDADSLMREAGAAVIVELTELAKAVSDLLRAIEDGHVAVSEKVFTLLAACSERLALVFGQLTRRTALSNGLYLVTNVNELIKASKAEQKRIAAEAASAQPAEVVELQQPEKTTEESNENRRQGPRVQHEMVRVRADLLDNMVNFAGEVSIYRSRVEQQLGAIRFNIDDLDQTVTRLRDQVRQFDIETEAQIDSRYREAVGQDYEEFDPLEFDRFTHMQQLSRSMMESLNDLLSIEEMMLNLSRESETLLLQQSRVNTELQETLMHTRMVPLVEHAPRLRRIVRQTCAELKKEATLSFKGAEVEMDRNVVERILAPLEHMLRNSVAHGIEPPEKRLAAQKAVEGSIVIALSREGSEVVIRVSDDGGGINLDSVRRKAVETGLMAPDTKLSDKEVMHFILEAGFSTAESLSQIAGRGVGMDVVASEIKQLGGVLEIDSEAGKGTRFTIRLPLTLSVSRALLVYAGEDIYAIPLLSITGIERISKSELDKLLAAENPQYRWIGQDFDLLHLSRALGVSSAAPVTEEKVSLLLAQSGDNRVALAVDGLVGSREIVVKSLGAQLSSLQDISGATILADGHVALIVDLPSLIRRGLARRSGGSATVVAMPAPVVASIPTVMVVDDSITVRKVTERLLKRHNMKCVTAKDGVDALAVLEEVTPDVMLLDIEMPRMDGYELATHIRNSATFHNLPIIMITSRTGEKHRQRAMDIGVNIYMGKPYTEADLLDNIEQLLKPRNA